MGFLKQLIFSRKLCHWVVVIILVHTSVSMGAIPGIGASISAGSRFSVGGRLKCAFNNQMIPQPMFSLTGTPLAKKKLHRIGESEYIQLREKNLYFDFGLLEQFPLSQYGGLEVEASMRVVTGWYRGTERKYPAEISPTISVGPYLRRSKFSDSSLLFQWYRIDNLDFFVCTFLFDFLFNQ